MNIYISKSDYQAFLSLTDKAIAIIKQKSPTTREYNVARQLGNIKKKVERNNQDNGKEFRKRSETGAKEKNV